MKTNKLFTLTSSLKPAGDQPKAIEHMRDAFAKGKTRQVLHGVTGSGKTFTIANAIETFNRPALVLGHNKTLAHQVYQELKSFFPHNRVEYFISYFDYYQPESYLPQTDTYIEKDSRVNKDIELMRLKATASLLSRQDVIVVSSISCIYGLGNPQDWRDMACEIKVGAKKSRIDLFSTLVAMQYERNDTMPLKPGAFRVRASVVDIVLGYESKFYLRVVYQGQTICSITERDIFTDECIAERDSFLIFPARHFVLPQTRVDPVLTGIKKELTEHAPTLGPLERHRIEQRTKYDMELISESGYCNGIENYSMYFDGRSIDDPPYCLLDFFPKDFVCFIDESHQTLPQAHAMYHGDRARKKNLIDYGFRLPSAYSNRPLKFEEFEKYLSNVVFVSATPGDYEYKTADIIVEQVVRPTGLLDPVLEIRPSDGQIDNLIGEIKKEIERGGRILVTALTKRMSEELSTYLREAGVAACYLHSEIKTLERTSVIRQLRTGRFNVLVGVNLLREGLDIPEVTLIAILDADREGFLRDERSLIQTIGRAARNSAGRVILYANKMTNSMRRAIDETNRRRIIQERYNTQHGITPQTVFRALEEEDQTVPLSVVGQLPDNMRTELIERTRVAMEQAAADLDFERAIELRDYMTKLMSAKSEPKKGDVI